MTDMIPRAGADARVAAVLEAAAQHHDIHAEGYSKTCQAADAAAHREHAKRIRALTPDDARSTLEAMLAGGAGKAAPDRPVTVTGLQP